MKNEKPKAPQKPKPKGKKEKGPNPQHRQDFERLLDDAIGVRKK